MQRLVVLLAAGLALAATSSAAGDTVAPLPYIASPVWISPPPEAALPTTFPDADYKAFVPLLCDVHGDVLSACAAVDTAPPTAFMDAALSAATAARIGPQDGGGRATDGRKVFLMVHFPARPTAPNAADAPPASAPGGLVGATWLERPTAADFDRYYPRAAMQHNVSGRTVMDCLVKPSGRLLCTVTSEAPAGAGFGDASVIISSAFRLAPQLQDGRPTAGAFVRVPITFNAPQ